MEELSSTKPLFCRGWKHENTLYQVGDIVEEDEITAHQPGWGETPHSVSYVILAFVYESKKVDAPLALLSYAYQRQDEYYGPDSVKNYRHHQVDPSCVDPVQQGDWIMSLIDSPEGGEIEQECNHSPDSSLHVQNQLTRFSRDSFRPVELASQFETHRVFLCEGKRWMTCLFPGTQPGFSSLSSPPPFTFMQALEYAHVQYQPVQRVRTPFFQNILQHVLKPLLLHSSFALCLGLQGKLGTCKKLPKPWTLSCSLCLKEGEPIYWTVQPLEDLKTTKEWTYVESLVDCKVVNTKQGDPTADNPFVLDKACARRLFQFQHIMKALHTFQHLVLTKEDAQTKRMFHKAQEPRMSSTLVLDVLDKHSMKTFWMQTTSLGVQRDVEVWKAYRKLEALCLEVDRFGVRPKRSDRSDREDREERRVLDEEEEEEIERGGEGEGEGRVEDA